MGVARRSPHGRTVRPLVALEVAADTETVAETASDGRPEAMAAPAGAPARAVLVETPPHVADGVRREVRPHPASASASAPATLYDRRLAIVGVTRWGVEAPTSA